MQRNVSGRLLVLAPSEGFGGGIERVASAVRQAWPGPVEQVALYSKGIHGAPRGRPQAKVRFTGRALRAAYRRPAVVLSLHVGLLPAALAAARVDGARLGLIAHGTEVWAPMSGRQRRMVQRCDRVLAVSSFTAHWVTRRAALEPGRVRRLWLPIDEGLATRAGQVRPRGPSNEIVTVSRLDPEHRYKGHFDIAESLPRVLERCPDARWNIVGVGDDLPALRARCRDLGIGEAARFLGSLSDSRLAETYATAAALVLPSTADVSTTPPEGEGFGLVFAEAAAFGVPSIASAQGGGSVDLVVDGQTGLTVPPQDPAGLAAAILRLLEDRSLRDRLGEGARALVRERHTSERFSEALVAGLS